MTIDIIKELHRISNELADMIRQEQDDKCNGLLVDCYDAVGAALVVENELAHDEPEEPMGKPVPMD